MSQAQLLEAPPEQAAPPVEHDEPDATSLPANAYKVLAPGETYRPLVAAGSTRPELTARRRSTS
jgi:hypothetical protein